MYAKIPHLTNYRQIDTLSQERFLCYGIENFKYALGVDADFTKDLASAFTSMLTNVPIQIFVSLFIAILLNGQFKGRGFFRAIFFIPIILATGITTIELSEVSLTAQTSESVVNLDWQTDPVYA